MTTYAEDTVVSELPPEILQFAARRGNPNLRASKDTAVSLASAFADGCPLSRLREYAESNVKDLACTLYDANFDHIHPS